MSAAAGIPSTMLHVGSPAPFSQRLGGASPLPTHAIPAARMLICQAYGLGSPARPAPSVRHTVSPTCEVACGLLHCVGDHGIHVCHHVRDIKHDPQILRTEKGYASAKAMQSQRWLATFQSGCTEQPWMAQWQALAARSPQTYAPIQLPTFMKPGGGRLASI